MPSDTRLARAGKEQEALKARVAHPEAFMSHTGQSPDSFKWGEDD